MLYISKAKTHLHYNYNVCHGKCLIAAFILSSTLNHYQLRTAGKTQDEAEEYYGSMQDKSSLSIMGKWTRRRMYQTRLWDKVYLTTVMEAPAIIVLCTSVDTLFRIKQSKECPRGSSYDASQDCYFTFGPYNKIVIWYCIQIL